MAQINPKTLVVAWDAACWEYLDPLLHSGELPAFQKLQDSGIWGDLTSTMPAWTPVAWASIVTGKNPGRHGVFDLLWRRPLSYEFQQTNSTLCRGTPFWRYLNDQGVRVGLVNVPFAHPPSALDGFTITGFGTPSSAEDKTYPPELADWIEERFGTYQPWLQFKDMEGLSPRERIQADRKHQAQQVKIACGLGDELNADVLVINLMLPDHANHLLPGMGQVQEAIRQTDKDLDTLLQTFQPDNVLLISDHGARRVKGDFLLHVWLRDHGFCVQAPRKHAERPAALNWILVQWLRESVGLRGLPEVLARRALVQIVPVLPSRAAKWFWQKVEQDIPFAQEHYEKDGELDYARTPVFVGSARSGLIYLNQVDREPLGIVPSGEVHELMSGLADKLSKIADPKTNKPIFSSVHTGEGLYPVRTVDNVPDLILDFYDADWNIAAAFRRGADLEQIEDRYFAQNLAEFGHHGRDGLFVFAGEHFNTGPASFDGSVMDVPATLLHLYGVPIPEDFDGQVLTEAFTSDFMAQHPIRFQEGDPPLTPLAESEYTAEQAAEVANHLKMLGYIE